MEQSTEQSTFQIVQIRHMAKGPKAWAVQIHTVENGCIAKTETIAGRFTRARAGQVRRTWMAKLHEED
jgi:hypothetical protein